MAKRKIKDPPAPKMRDAVEKWSAEAGVEAAGPINELRLGASEVMFIPFTTSVVEAAVHYLPWDSAKGYVQCNGAGCLLCRVNQERSLRDLLPVYAVAERAVAVLPVSPDQRPGTLRPQLTPILSRLKDGALLVLARKLSTTRYSVVAEKLPEKADDGAGAVADHLKAAKAGRVDLAAIYRRLTNEEIGGIPEVANILAMRGLAR